MNDFVFSDGLKCDDDYTLVSPSLSSRVGIDATRKQGGEISQPWPKTLAMSEEIQLRLQNRWIEYGVGERMKDER